MLLVRVGFHFQIQNKRQLVADKFRPFDSGVDCQLATLFWILAWTFVRSVTFVHSELLRGFFIPNRYCLCCSRINLSNRIIGYLRPLWGNNRIIFVGFFRGVWRYQGVRAHDRINRLSV